MTTPLPSRLRASAQEMRSLESIVRVAQRIARELEEAAQALEVASNKPTRDQLGTLLAALRFGQYTTEQDYHRLKRAIDIALADFDIGNASFSPPSAQVAQEGAAGVATDGGDDAREP